MKTTSRVLVAALLASVLVPVSVGLSAPDASAPAKKKTIGSALRLADRDLEMAARAWQRIFGETVTITERAKSRKVSMDISAPKDEFRPLFVAALRENGIYVIQGRNGVLFDTEPAAAEQK